MAQVEANNRIFCSIQVSDCWSFAVYGNAMRGALDNDEELKGHVDYEVVVGKRNDHGGYGYVFAARTKEEISTEAKDAICWWNEANSKRLFNAKGFEVGDQWKQIGIQVVKPDLLEMLK